MINELFKVAVRNIVHRKRRAWLTIIGIFIGIAAVVALVSLGQGLQQSVESEFEQIGSDKVFINPGGDQTRGQTTSSHLTEDDLQAVRNAQAVENAAGVIFSTTTSEFQGEQGFVTVLGLPTDETQSLVETSWAIEIEEGRKTRSTDSSSVVIGSTVAQDAFEDEVELRNQITIKGEEFRVIGIMKPTGDPSIDRSVTIPFERARELVDRDEGSYDWIFAGIQEGFTPEEAKEDIERNMRRVRNVEEGNEDFTVSTQEDLLDSFNQILGVVQGVVIGIAGISLLVGGVGIMNTMYTSVTERTREIGVMKAIGATRRQILLIFLMESGIIGLFGGILGLLAGVGLSTLASMAATNLSQIQINPYISPELVLGSLVFAFLLGMISGVLPAIRASKLEPAEALRYE